MRRLRAWAVRLVGLVDPWARRRRETQLDAELESHLEMHVEDNLRRGMTPVEARRRALIALGGMQVVKEAYHERGGVPLLEALAQDLRTSIRALRKAPGFAASAVLILALGIGANGAMFSLINALLLRPLGGTALTEQLVGLYSADRARPDAFRGFSYPEYADIRDRNRVFAGVIGEMPVSVGITQGQLTRQVRAIVVSSNYFSTLGVSLAAGRGFTSGEERSRDFAPVAVVSYAFWRDRGLPADLVGQPVIVNGRSLTIVGVVPEGFNGTMPVMSAEIWLPFGASGLIATDRNADRWTRFDGDRAFRPLLLAGVLNPGVSIQAAERQLADVMSAMASEFPEHHRDERLIVHGRSRVSMGPRPRSDVAPMLGASVLMAVSGLVLLVACLNLANLPWREAPCAAARSPSGQRWAGAAPGSSVSCSSRVLCCQRWEPLRRSASRGGRPAS